MKESEYPVVPQAPKTGMAAVWQALRRALISQCHPKMLGAMLLPFVIALFGAIILLWFFWTPLTEWLTAASSDWAIVNQMDEWALALGLFSIKLYLIPLIAAAILLPLSGILGLIIAAVFLMPIVLRHIEDRHYRGLSRQGKHATAVGAWNALWVGGLFASGWLVTMPLWLIPPLPLLLPVFWWAFAFSRMLRVDALVEHASVEERRLIWRRDNREYWMLGLVLALLNLLPPAWLFLPVFSALVFAHYSLESLSQLRAQTIVDA